MKDKLGSLQVQQDNAIQQEEYLLAKKIDQEMSDLTENIKKISIEASEKDERPLEKKSDPVTISKCLDIIFAMLQIPQIDNVHASLLSLKEELFKEIMLFEDPHIQEKYIKCFGMICCLNPKFARENAAFFTLPVGTIYFRAQSYIKNIIFVQLMLYKTGHNPEMEVLRGSVMCITDLLLLYGPNLLPETDHTNVQDNSVDFEVLFGNSVATISSVIEALSSMIHDEVIFFFKLQL